MGGEEAVSCGQCGHSLSSTSRFCAHCGASAGSSGTGGEETAFQAFRAGDVLDGKWRVEKKLGQGGMGTVFLAHDLLLDRKVAIKALAGSLCGDDVFVGRFVREAKLTAQLEHPNIVPIYAVGRHQNRPFIVMKNLEGMTLSKLLRTRIAQGSRMPREEILALMRQLCAGLAFIHAKGFVHRDIKASNIYVSPSGHATILDFGVLRDKTGGSGNTRTGAMVGTPHYMSPEQAMGLATVDHRSDLYSLAILLFECIAGTPPFMGDSELSVVMKQAQEPPPDVTSLAPDIPRSVNELLRKALAKSPEDRFQSATALLEALEVAWATSPSHAQRSPSVPPPPPEARSGPFAPPAAPAGIRPRSGPIASPAGYKLSDSEEKTDPKQRRPFSRAQLAEAAAGAERPTAPADPLRDTRPRLRPARRGAVDRILTAVAGLVASLRGATSRFVAWPSLREELRGCFALLGRGEIRQVFRQRPAVALALVAVVVGVAVGGAAFALLPDRPEAGEAPADRAGEAAPSTDPQPAGAAEAPSTPAAAAPALGLDLTAEPVGGAKQPGGGIADTSSSAATGSGTAPGNPTPAAATPADAAPSAVEAKAVVKPKKSQLRIITTQGGEPYWASVLIDGVRRGETPVVVDLVPGSYRIRLERTGFKPIERQITIAPGERQVLKTELVK